MGKTFRKLNICLLASALLCGAAAAQETRKISADEWIAINLVGKVRPSDTWDTVRQKMLMQYQSRDLNGGGISKSDIDLQHQINLARQRTSPMSPWLGQDLNADGQVTRAELEVIFRPQALMRIRRHGVWLTPTPEQVAQMLNKLIDDALKADVDGDGIVSFKEALTAANNTAKEKYWRSRSSKTPITMSLDENGDGLISEAEFMSAVDRALVSIDGNSDKQFSVEEITALGHKARQIRNAEKARLRTQRLNAAREKLVARCAFPKAPENSKIIILAAYEGEALSTVALGGDDAVVTATNVTIEAGTEPLYIVLNSHRPVIWQFSGSTDRVAYVIANTHQRDAKGAARVGVVGLSANRVRFPTVAKCVQHTYKTQHAKSHRTADLLRQFLGRPADIVVGRYGVSGVQLPSGAFIDNAPYTNAVALPQVGPGAPLWREMKRFNPGGLVQIDPRAVVSQATAKTYDVLPEAAGLAQLLEEGALQAIGSRQVITTGRTRIVPGDGDDKIIRPKGRNVDVMSIPKEFLIVRKMTFPAGLYGAHGVRFVLKSGVPRPDGSPGHSKIREQDQ
ncbi:MAG: hypothetical protein MJE12_10305 [Alphaproteobacteria bacterium]|nr:hypothetical protein [Alphaproteobacteria bacterium]